MKTLLHVGCGPKTISNLPQYFSKGWAETRFDIDEKVKPDIIGTLTDMAAVEDDSCDAIWSSHNIEHLFAGEAHTACREFLRVLKPGGFIVITCPDLRVAVEFAAKHGIDETLYTSSAGPITPRDIIFGHQAAIKRGNEYMAHKNGFDLQSLNQLLSNAGFPIVYGLRKSRNLWFIAGDFPTHQVAAKHLNAILA